MSETSASAKTPVGVLISGRGSNMAALLEASARPDYPARIALVLSNAPEAGGLALAAAQGTPTAVVDHRAHPGDREAFEAAIDAELRAHGVELVCLAGFMRILTPWFVERWRNRVLNIHPSLLPAFPGLDTHARALASGALWHGATVHVATAALDDGPIVAQAAVPVAPDDDPDALQARVLEAEHRLYPHALKLFLSPGTCIEGNRVIPGEAVETPGAAINPPLSAP